MYQRRVDRERECRYPCVGQRHRVAGLHLRRDQTLQAAQQAQMFNQMAQTGYMSTFIGK